MIVNGVVLATDLGPARKISKIRLLRPVIAAAVIIPFFAGRSASHGMTLAVEIAGVAAGLLCGLAASALMGVYRSPTTGKPVSRAGLPYAIFWAMILARTVTLSARVQAPGPGPQAAQRRGRRPQRPARGLPPAAATLRPGWHRCWLAGSDRKDAPMPLGRPAAMTGMSRQSLAWAMPQIRTAAELSGPARARPRGSGGLRFHRAAARPRWPRRISRSPGPGRTRPGSYMTP